MPDWLLPLGALAVLLAFLYFAFIHTKRAAPSGNDPDNTHSPD